MFNRNKVRRLESELQNTKNSFDGFKADTERRISDKDGRIADLVAALKNVADLIGSSNVQAKEVVAAAISEDLDDQQLPSVDIKITIADIKNVGIGKELGELSQSFSFALGEFLRCPNISSISPGSERYEIEAGESMMIRAMMRHDLRSSWDGTRTRPTTEISIHSRYIVELEEVTGAVLSFLEKAFENHKAQVAIRNMSKEDRPSISYRVQVD